MIDGLGLQLNFTKINVHTYLTFPNCSNQVYRKMHKYINIKQDSLDIQQLFFPYYQDMMHYISFKSTL